MYLLLGPVRIFRQPFGFEASWWGIHGRTETLPIDPIWNDWIHGHLTCEQQLGLMESWIPISMLWEHPGWVDWAQKELVEFGFGGVRNLCRDV